MSFAWTRLLLQQLHLEKTLYAVSQVFFLAAGDLALSFVEEVCQMGSRMDMVSVRGLQRALQESIEVMNQHVVTADQEVLRPCQPYVRSPR